MRVKFVFSLIEYSAVNRNLPLISPHIKTMFKMIYGNKLQYTVSTGLKDGWRRWLKAMDRL